MNRYQISPRDTVGLICAKHNMSRAEFFYSNPEYTDRVVLTEDGVTSADMQQGEWIHIRRLPSRRQPNLGRSNIYMEGDISVGDSILLYLRDNFPIFGALESAAENRISGEDFVNGLSADGVIAIGAVCTFAGALIGKLASAKLSPAGGAAVSAVLSGACAYLTKILAENVASNKPSKPGQPEKPTPPGQPEKPTPSCESGEKFFPEYLSCGSADAFNPCQDENGFVSFEGTCIACPDGHYYDSSSRSCEPGCPQGQPMVNGICLLKDYSTRCTTQDGQRGVKMSSATPCVLDGCEEGFIYDFATEQCRPEGGFEIITNKTTTTTKSSMWPWIFGSAALLGGVWWFSKNRPNELLQSRTCIGVLEPEHAP